MVSLTSPLPSVLDWIPSTPEELAAKKTTIPLDGPASEENSGLSNRESSNAMSYVWVGFTALIIIGGLIVIMNKKDGGGILQSVAAAKSKGDLRLLPNGASSTLKKPVTSESNKTVESSSTKTADTPDVIRSSAQVSSAQVTSDRNETVQSKSAETADKQDEIKSPVSAATGKTDLLSGIDLKVDVIQGGWEWKGKRLITQKSGEKKRSIRLQKMQIPDEYDIDLSIERQGGSGINVVFMMPGHQSILVMEQWAWWIESIDGKSHKTSPAYVKLHTAPGDKFDARLEVRKDGLAVYHNEKEVLSWKGKPDQLSVSDYWASLIPENDRLYLMTNGLFAVDKIELIPKGTAAIIPKSAPSMTKVVPAIPSVTPAGPSSRPTPAATPKNISISDVPGAHVILSNYLKARRAQVKVLSAKYESGLAGRFNQATNANDLKLSNAFEEEKIRLGKLVAALGAKPDNLDSAVGNRLALGQLPDGAPEGLVDLRKTWASEREKIRVTLDKALDKSLKSLASRLTEGRDLDNARKVAAFQEFLTESGFSSTAKPVTMTTVGSTTKVPPVTTSTSPIPLKSASSFSISKPFENSLGQRFVPVPISGGPTDGQEVLFSIWETRVGDYEKFIRQNKDRQWREPYYKQKKDHPAVLMLWQDAMAFCEWLTERERRSGKIRKNQMYRLPTDHEWSCVVGIGQKEKAEDSSRDKDGRIKIYPWGTEMPPPKGFANYYGEETRKRPEGDLVQINKYNDGFDRTSPVGSFKANEFGLYDLAGNVWEWCFDDVRGNGRIKHIFRGGSFLTSGSGELRSSIRYHTDEKDRNGQTGFRIVLANSVKQ